MKIILLNKLWRFLTQFRLILNPVEKSIWLFVEQTRVLTGTGKKNDFWISDMNNDFIVVFQSRFTQITESQEPQKYCYKIIHLEFKKRFAVLIVRKKHFQISGTKH